MADLNEPKKETVRIAVPNRPPGSAEKSPAGSDTVRINLPTRPPSQLNPTAPENISANRPPAPPKFSSPRPPAAAKGSISAPPVRKPPTPSFRPPAKPIPSAAPAAKPDLAAAGIYPDSPLDAGPKKETARISITPDVPRPAVNMTKTQPLSIAPAAVVHRAPVQMDAPANSSTTDLFSEKISWAFAAVSAVIFLIQVWNYVSL